MSTQTRIGAREHTLFAWTADGLSAEEYHAQFLHRFWAKVDKRPGQGPKGECWTWRASRRSRGYGQLAFRWPDGRFSPIGAPTASLYIHTGQLPPSGYETCHRCDFPPCVRPDHLWYGTHAQNMHDAQAKGRLPTYVERRVRARRARFSAEQLAKIKAARQDCADSIFDIAALLGVDFSFISLFENGKRPTLPEDKAVTLLAHLGLEMEPEIYTHFVGRKPKNPRRQRSEAKAA